MVTMTSNRIRRHHPTPEQHLYSCLSETMTTVACFIWKTRKGIAAIFDIYCTCVRRGCAVSGKFYNDFLKREEIWMPNWQIYLIEVLSEDMRTWNIHYAYHELHFLKEAVIDIDFLFSKHRRSRNILYIQKKIYIFWFAHENPIKKILQTEKSNNINLYESDLPKLGCSNVHNSIYQMADDTDKWCRLKSTEYGNWRKDYQKLGQEKVVIMIMG